VFVEEEKEEGNAVKDLRVVSARGGGGGVGGGLRLTSFVRWHRPRHHVRIA